MGLDILNVSKKYSNQISDKFHRDRSWDYCFNAFSVNEPTENHALQLGFYLASWGMFRNSWLLEKNHLVHQGAVDILFSKENQKLKCSNLQDVTKDSIKSIIILKEELSNHYDRRKFTKGSEKQKQIPATDTLISKVMLGTLGCVPAYDTYFVVGLKNENKNYHAKFGKDSLNELFDFIQKNSDEIKQCQQLIRTQTDIPYPAMKIIDMYFWQKGVDINNKNKPTA